MAIRTSRALLTVAMVFCLCGCTWVKERWPWREKEVPVTPPAQTAGQDAQRAAAPAPQNAAPPAPDSAPRPAPPSRPAPAASPSADTDAGGPVMLENLVTGVAPIRQAETLPPTADEYSASPAGYSPATAPASAAPVRPTGTRPGVSPAQAPVSPAQAPVAAAPPATAPAPVPASRPRMSAPRELPAPGDVDGSDSQVVAASLLRVNGDYLTVDDILRAAADRLKELPADMPEQAFRTSAAQIIQQTIDQQVLQTLVYAEAGRRLSDEQNKYIDRELERKLREMVANAGGSRTRLEEDLAVQGTDLKTVAKDARRDMSVSLFLNQRFQPAITVTRGMLWDYYQQHISEYSTPRQVQMQIIAAPFADFISATAPSDADVSAARSAARALVEQARAAVAGGEDFGAVARGLSRGVKASGGGLWPMMPAGSFRERPVERAAFTMNEGQVSDVIETDTGCYLVKVRKVEAGTVVSFEDAQQRIDQALRREKAARLEQEYLDKLLRRSDVNQDRRFIPLAVDRATDLYHRG